MYDAQFILYRTPLDVCVRPEYLIRTTTLCVCLHHIICVYVMRPSTHNPRVISWITGLSQGRRVLRVCVLCP